MNYKNTIFIIIFFIILSGIPAINGIGTIFLTHEDFAFRAWEIMYDRSTPGPFRPNKVFEKTIFGDLANMLKVREFRQYRYQKFSSDKYGFRNPKYNDNTYFPIVATGDSDMAGSSLSDEETYSYCLGKKLKVSVYSYAPSSPIAFLGDKRFKDSPPEILIWEAIERTITGKAYSRYSGLSEHMEITLNKPKVTKNKNENLPRLSDYVAKSLFHEVRWKLTGILPESIGYIDKQNKMLFYRNGLRMLNLPSKVKGLDTVLDGIEAIHRYCYVRGITLIFIPLPDKENIYRHLLPQNMTPDFPENNFIEKLHKGLDQRNILNVKLYDKFRKQAKKGETLYFPDDTHWNKDGVSTAVELTMNLIGSFKNIQLLQQKEGSQPF